METMSGKHCRLYDENLVHNIIISSGLSVLEYLKEHIDANNDEICEFLEINANAIIEDTIEELNSTDDCSEKDSNYEKPDSVDENWPFGSDEEIK
jgi:hypothetical protein